MARTTTTRGGHAADRGPGRHPRRPAGVLQARRPAVAALLALAAVLVLSACAPQEEAGDWPAAGPAACEVPAGSRQLDVDREDSPETPWRKPPGRELVVYFETGSLSGRYADLVEEAAPLWSQSPCLDARAVGECPDGSNCVAVEEREEADGFLFFKDHDTDGMFSGEQSGGFREGGTIVLYTGILDGASDDGALATVVHEMGHALGLVHRNDGSDVMNSSTDDETDPVPDGADFTNLAVIYGSQG